MPRSSRLRRWALRKNVVDGSPMPSFADQLQPAEAWDLVHFLRTLQPLKTPEATIWRAWFTTHGRELKPIGQEGGGQ